MSVVKSGYLKRYSKNLFSGGWGEVFLTLYQDSYLMVYKKQGDRDHKARICMKDVCKHFAYGDHVGRNFKDMPQLPGGASMSCVIAIPEKPSHKAKPHFFLANNEHELHEWMTAICSTLPQRPQSSKPQESMIQPTSSQPVSAPMGGPPGYPGLPPPGGPPMPQPIGFGGVAPPPGPAQYPQQAYPQQPGYPQQSPYPQQPAAGYPQQQYYPQQPYGYQQPPPPAGYAPQPGYAPAPGYAPQPGYGQPYGQQPQVVYVQDHKKKGGGIMGSNTGKMAAGLIGGAALGYGASRMMGGFGPFGGFGMGRCGSWSSLSSFGSCGSFGSFGSFD